jgi:hypothetical protein
MPKTSQVKLVSDPPDGVALFEVRGEMRRVCPVPKATIPETNTDWISRDGEPPLFVERYDRR